MNTSNIFPPKNSQQTSNNINYDLHNKQQLSVKAYFMNKYETFKNPNDQDHELISNGSNFFLNGNSPIATPSPQTPSTSTANLMAGQFELTNTKQAAKRHFSGGGSNSSLQNSEDDDDEFDEMDMSSKSREEKRRLSHTVAEQKRRNAIKHGYDELQSLVPSCEYMDPSSSQKVCKATILKRCFELLQKVLPSYKQQLESNIISTRITRADTLEQTIDYIRELEMDKNKHEHEADSLKKEILALKILKSNYEEILKHHRNIPKDNTAEQMDEAKFELFTKIADSLFQSFQAMTNPNSFVELSSTMLSWLEQVCTSQNLKNLIRLSMAQMQSFT